MSRSVRSIRRYLVIVLLAFIALGNFVAALNGYRSGLDRAEQLLDQQLAEQIDRIAQLQADGALNNQLLLTHEQLFQVWSEAGMLFRSSNAPTEPLFNHGQGYHFASFDGHRWRLLILESASGEHLLVAEQYDHYVEFIEELLIENVLPILWITPLLLLVVSVVTLFGLKPVRTLAKELSSRFATDFSELSEAEYPEELSEVVTSINELFSRLESAFEREHRFASDAAHELKTPLTAVKLGLHNLQQSILEGAQQLSLDEVEGMQKSLARMSHTIDQLLALYRITPAGLEQSLESVDLYALVAEEIVELHPTFQRKDQEIGLEGESVELPCNRFALRTLVINLLDNASKYTPEGGVIQATVATESLQQQVILVVEDSGPGIPEEEITHVFDRFYRVGRDRHASGVTGCGLGLSIVEHVVKLHSGIVHLSRSTELGGLRVEIRWPTTHRGLGQSC